MRILAAFSIFVAASLLAASADAQATGEQEAWTESSGYSESAYEAPTPRMIIQQKAHRRAMARIQRIEANNAYGMYNARPTASALPFTSMYSPAWQMPGGRPFAWYTTRRPQYILWR